MTKTKKILLILGVLLLGLIGGFSFYVNDYYEAEEVARLILEDASIEIKENLTILKGTSDIGIIFYPGAKVEAISYLPILKQLQEQGLTCVLVEMPFHMAIFNTNGADAILYDTSETFAHVEEWYMAGHSMGGGMASAYASKNPDLIEGLLLMGAYVYGDYPPEQSLTIYGTHNSNLEEKISYTENIVILEGGNHAQFGNYGKQKGDPDADISPQEQQQQTIEAIISFLNLS